MAIAFHNTLSGKVEPFEPTVPGEARIYVCGPTVYNHAHVGHMRSALTYDVLVRHLRERGQRVTFIRNITDIDDKILASAAKAGEDPGTLARRFEASYRRDTQRLGLLVPDAEPRVSEHLPEIHALITRLIEKGAAYVSAGDVYFDVRAFPEYGKLSHRKQNDLEFGASGRLDDEEVRRKRHPADFALWKAAKPGEASWESPWGKGRPGWHIECSAMAMRYLGESFDLHGGGLDLVFPHHENEIAQAEAATGKTYCKSWVHHGFVETQREKMSKSLGNFLTARDSFELAEPEALRYLLLTVHYRAPLALDWSTGEGGQVTACAQLEEAERRVEYIYRTRERLSTIPEQRVVDEGEVAPEIGSFGARLAAALDEDLNTPVALAAVADFLRHTNDLAEQAKGKGRPNRQALAAAEQGFAALAGVLGLGAEDPVALLGRIRSRRAQKLGVSEREIETKIEARVKARKAGDFAQADSLRNELVARGIELMDGPAGTHWRIP